MKTSARLLTVSGVALLVGGFVLAGDANKPVSFGTNLKVGPLSASPDGTRCIAIPIFPISPVFCNNSGNGEDAFGVSTPFGSLVTGGRGKDGKNNFVKIGSPILIGVDGLPIGPQVSVKITTPSFTRSGITTGSILDVPEKESAKSTAVGRTPEQLNTGKQPGTGR